MAIDKRHTCMYHASMKKTLQQQIALLPNLSEFARFSGLPRRTLNRVRAGNNINITTKYAVQAALKEFQKSS